ncbi:hypothetical protein [Pseudomonas aeruginosa]|uniref:hypothetical protein n=1 Tax=Pseudomonas aeruginosa TaxID=287 RepID=UPI0034E0AD7D
MQHSSPIHARRVLTFTLLVGFLGFQIGSLFQPAEKAHSVALNCEAPSELPRLACVSYFGPADASPLPPQG